MIEENIQIDRVPVVARYPLVDTAFNGQPVQYGIELIAQSTRDVEAIVLNHVARTNEVLNEHDIVVVRCTESFDPQIPKGIYVVDREEPEFFKVDLPFHVDVIDSLGGSYLAHNWAYSGVLLGQNSCKEGRSAATIGAPSWVISRCIQMAIDDSDFPTGPELEAFDVKTIVRETMAFTTLLLAYAEGLDEKTDTSFVMAFYYTFLHVMSAKRECQIAVAQHYGKKIFSLARACSVEMDWSTPANTAGALVIMNGGEKGATSKPIVHARRNLNSEPPSLESSVYRYSFPKE